MKLHKGKQQALWLTISTHVNNRISLLKIKLKQKFPFLNKIDFSLLKKLKLSTPSLVGVDIGPERLKVLKINSTTTPFTVEGFSTMLMPIGAVVKDEIKDYAAIGAVLKKMFKQARLKTKNVALAISHSSVITKTITIGTKLKPNEIESRAWIEANKNFPDLVGEMHLDFTISTNSTQKISQQELTLVVCRKDQLKPYLEILRAAGLRAKIVDVNCYALERALALVVKSSTELKTIALLNLNAGLSTLIVTDEGNLIHTYDQSYDGQRFITQTNEYLKNHDLLNKELNESLINDEGYRNVLKESLLSHLLHTMHFFYASRPHFSIQKIILSGDCANIPYLALFIQQEIGIDTQKADPFTHLTIAPHINKEQLDYLAPTLMLCCGLALSKVNNECEGIS